MNPRGFKRNVLRCSPVAICSSHLCCSFRDEIQKAQKLPANQAQHSYIWTLGDMTYISLKTRVQTFNTISQQSTTASFPCENILQMDRHSFYFWQTARHPDKHLITPHLAPITLHRHHQRRRATVAQHTEGFGLSVQVVLAPTPFRLENETHSTVTHHLNLTAYKGSLSQASSSDNTPQCKQTKASSSFESNWRQQTKASFFWTCLSFSGLCLLSRRSLQHNTPPTNRHVWLFTRLQLMTQNHSRHRSHRKQHSDKQMHWHADRWHADSFESWLGGWCFRNALFLPPCPSIVLPFS